MMPTIWYYDFPRAGSKLISAFKWDLGEFDQKGKLVRSNVSGQ
jgi:hypothetical protein